MASQRKQARSKLEFERRQLAHGVIWLTGINILSDQREDIIVYFVEILQY